MFIYLNGRRVWTELSAADSGGNDGGGNDGNRDQTFQRLLDRNNSDGIGLARELFTENFKYRERNDDLKRQLADLQGKVPVEGSTVISVDDAAALAAYKALGKPDEVKQGLDEKANLQGKLAGMERETTLRTVAETVGYKAGVLANLDRMAKAEGKALDFNVRDTTVDGKTIKAAFVKDGDKELPLTEYASVNWSDFMPALTVQGTQQQAQSGIRYPTQYTGNGGQEKQTTKTVAIATLNKAYAPRKAKES